jgi:hypothetical protein
MKRLTSSGTVRVRVRAARSRIHPRLERLHAWCARWHPSVYARYLRERPQHL